MPSIPSHEPCLLEAREDLRKESLGEILEPREVANADGRLARRDDEERVQRVLGTGSVQG